MKTTVVIPENELRDAIRFTRARTKRAAIVTAIAEFNRRRRMAELTKGAGTCERTTISTSSRGPCQTHLNATRSPQRSRPAEPYGLLLSIDLY